MDQFIQNPELADPNLNLPGFFPILLESFGTWDGKVYGLPFDNYSGLLFYNACQLKEPASTSRRRPGRRTAHDVRPEAHRRWPPRLRAAVPPRRDAVGRQLHARPVAVRRLLLDAEFKSNLMAPESQAGLEFRQDLMKVMPPGIVDYDHSEAVNALAQGNVAMITEWSAFYGTLTDPGSSKILDCLAVAPELRVRRA